MLYSYTRAIITGESITLRKEIILKLCILVELQYLDLRAGLKKKKGPEACHSSHSHFPLWWAPVCIQYISIDSQCYCKCSMLKCMFWRKSKYFKYIKNLVFTTQPSTMVINMPGLLNWDAFRDVTIPNPNCIFSISNIMGLLRFI